MRPASKSEEERTSVEVGRVVVAERESYFPAPRLSFLVWRDLTMSDRISRVNPVAKAMMQSRRRAQVVPNKKKYNRKRDKHAGEDRQVPHKADKQTTDD